MDWKYVYYIAGRTDHDLRRWRIGLTVLRDLSEFNRSGRYNLAIL